MTGPEHYKEAERLLADLRAYSGAHEVRVAEAQVHATLALVAATTDVVDHDVEWYEAIS